MTATETWALQGVPGLADRTFLVTGATSGIGLVTAAELACQGAAVTLAVRDLQRADSVMAAIRSRRADARVDAMRLDLADLASVRTFAEEWRSTHTQGLDVLINNAGVMAPPLRRTVDGFELQFGTNHLGHFALTGLLLPAISADGRIVTVSSGAHRMGRINFDNLDASSGYSRWAAYGQSKLANLLFTRELQDRLIRHGRTQIAVAAHPGYAATNLQTAGARMSGSKWSERFMSLANSVLAQSAEAGALPTLYAATAPDIAPGAYVGPDGLGEMRGKPTLVGMSAAAQDRATAQRLWTVSEELTGVHYLD
jgi:NAD(P)-dependent dehydrogenase (short-subunit alcohol dehydrogenase family)